MTDTIHTSEAVELKHVFTAEDGTKYMMAVSSHGRVALHRMHPDRAPESALAWFAAIQFTPKFPVETKPV